MPSLLAWNRRNLHPGATAVHSGLVIGWAMVAAITLAVSGCGAAETGQAAPPAGAATKAPVNQAPASRQPTESPVTGAAGRESKRGGAAGQLVAQARPFPSQGRAPPLDGGVAWINTAGPIELKDLRGKFVILDFWTYCCINCMHILPELKKLEKAYPNEVVVIGVHSAKFDGEKDSKNITDAVLRYEIEHPVVNDAEQVIWNRYGVNSWPTLCVIDPEGNFLGQIPGEAAFETLDKLMKMALPYYRAKGLLDLRPLHFDLAAAKAADTPLRFPGKILADEKGGRLFIADSNHNRIVVAKLDGTLLDTIGSGRIGHADGGYATATFDHPQGMALRNQTLYVADTENHRLRKVDLEKKTVTTIAGNGQKGLAWPGLDKVGPGDDLPKRWSGKPRGTALNSPWALWIHDANLYIAMAGPHQIWKMPLSETEIGPYAGNGREDIVDGTLLPPRPFLAGEYASFAQPSGLAGDDKWLYVADSEGSSIRAVPFDPRQSVRTIVGTADLPLARLFTFGDVDGQGGEVRLQHVLDVAHVAGLLYVADTYNNKIKVIDPKKATSRTLAGTGKPGDSDNPATFDEPAGLSHAAGKLYVADTNNHRIRTIDLAANNRVATLTIQGLKPPAPAGPLKPSFAGARQLKLASQSVKPDGNKLRLKIELKLPEGYKINEQAPMRYFVEAESAKGPVDRGALGKLTSVTPPAASFSTELPLAAAQGVETLKVSLAVYYCQEGAEGLCKADGVVWTLPLKLDANARAQAATFSADLSTDPPPR